MHVFNCTKNNKSIFYNGDYSDIRIFDPETKEEIPVPLEREDFLAFCKMAFLEEVTGILKDNEDVLLDTIIRILESNF